MRCPRCDKPTPEDAIVCPYCATRLAAHSESDGPDESEGPLPPDEAPTYLDPAGAAVTSVPTLEAGGPPSLEDAETVMPSPGAETGPPTSGVGARAAPEEAETSMPSAMPGTPRPRASQHGRFLPGVTVADRYRIVGLLGTGGMGEVYRADDLKLGQQVALKFLPVASADDPTHVERLLDEVRMARQVSHPNVCRVFDVGEAEGQHYVSMEYVDGEDLASLLRRIGRLPKDKAVEIGRQLCAALAAAHDEGVLHRDLKPANIMLDGRGRVKLTDFGLAAVAEVRAGTPVYMAPEQLAGEEVSIKSDLYSLGLVLHELFTGKRVFEADSYDELTSLHQDTATSTLIITGEHDPAIDRVIQRCLERDPDKRPKSALAAAAGLPGADPLAAALAAGETPSPEMVAEAGGEGSLPLAIAVPLLLFALIGAIGVGLVQARESLVAWAPFDTPPAVLEARARDVVTTLGYELNFADQASGFDHTLGYIDWLRERDAVAHRTEAIASGRPHVIEFWWRGSPSRMSPLGNDGISSNPQVSLTDPPRTGEGMVSLQLDTLGNLLWLEVVPGRTVTEADASADADWAALFGLMGLDIDNFTPVSPRLNPPHYADERAAWEGRHPADPELELRVEAAALGGRPVSLNVFPAFDPIEPPAPRAPDDQGGVSLSLVAVVVVAGTVIILLLTAILGAVYVAQRNIRSGRGDARGARRLGFAVAVALAAEWFLTQRSFSFDIFDGLLQMFMFVAAAGGLTWALYLAVEPFMRRHAPAALIGWTRLIDGRLSDPLVGRDILIGVVFGTATRAIDVVPLVLDRQGATLVNYAGLPMATASELLATMLGIAALYVVIGLGISFLFGLSFVALGRRWWAAFGAWVILLAALAFLPGLRVSDVSPSVTTAAAVCWLVASILWMFVLVRLGILAYWAAAVTSWLIAMSLPSMNFSAWYAGSMLAGVAVLVALAAYAFYRSVNIGSGRDLAGALAGD